jgi:cytochrome c553
VKRVLILLAACGDSRLGADARPPDGTHPLDAPADVAVDAMPDAYNPAEPPNLLLTGLCLDPRCTQFSPDVTEYVPRFPLWADTATKRRWIYIPPGTQIDTTDMNHWKFPVGTKLWKEFTRDGVRVETRYIVKIGPGDLLADWFYIAYQWNAGEDATMAVPLGVQNANGTQHDIPSVTSCRACHERLPPSKILGFQAIQLDGATPFGLDDAIARGWLSNPPAGTSPHFPLPGGANEQAAIGYLHANCGHCHNPNSDVHNNTPVTLRLEVDHLATLADTATYKTTIDQMGSPIMENGTIYRIVVKTHDPDNSIMIVRMNATDNNHMPALGSEVVDPDAQVTLRTWINNL